MDLKHQTIHIGNEKLFLHQREATIAKVALAENVEVSTNCKLVIVARLNEMIPDDNPAMVKQRNHDQDRKKGFLLARHASRQLQMYLFT